MLRYRQSALILVLLFFTASCATAATTAALQSPWDEHLITPHEKSYSCPELAPLPKDITATSFYNDAKKSVIDPELYDAYNAAKKPYEEAMRETESAADNYRKSGSRSAAECVLHILSTEAAADSMTGGMSSNQAYYVQNWTLGALAASWLKVRGENPGTMDQQKKVTDWMQKVGDQTEAYFTARHAKGTKDGTNNHYYWAGFAVMAAAVASNNRPLYDWAKTTFAEAASRITPDGTLPLEMDRGQRALHYHLFALAPIIMMAEFGEANGEDFYAEDGRAVQRLVVRTIDGTIDNSYFTQKSGVPQDTPDKKGLTSNDIAWLVPYAARFPSPNLSKILHSVSIKPYDYMGGYPPGWNK